MKKQTAADLAMTASILALGASLVYSGGSLIRHRFAAAPAKTPLGLAEVVGAAAAGIGLAIAAWWVIALVCAVVSAIAETRGRTGLATRTAAWSPTFMRRLVAVVLGLQLMGAPMALADGGNGPIDPRWQPGTSTSESASSPSPEPELPGTRITPHWTPQPPAADPGSLGPVPTRPSDTSPGVVVHAGDSLWSIAADALGADASDLEVAVAWPEWYRSNRAVIGPDPNVILPGQILHAPGN